MSALAPTLQAWFTNRLIAQRNVSPHTIRAYRDTLRLLLDYAEARLGRQPSQLDIAELDAPLIAGFLDHLETERARMLDLCNARDPAVDDTVLHVLGDVVVSHEEKLEVEVPAGREEPLLVAVELKAH